jgi:hypothetical protein
MSQITTLEYAIYLKAYARALLGEHQVAGLEPGSTVEANLAAAQGVHDAKATVATLRSLHSLQIEISAALGESAT